MRLILFTWIVFLLFGNKVFAGEYQLADSLWSTGYTNNNKYIPNAFPREVISRDFSIPIVPDQLLVIYPAEAEKQAVTWRRSLYERIGVEISFIAADKLNRDDLGKHHLIILGNMNDNPWVLELYNQRYAFADAYFPGNGGFIISPATSIWNHERNVLTIGASQTQDLNAAFEAFLTKLTPNARSIGAIRSLKTDLAFNDPPKSVQPLLDDVLENAKSKMAPYATIANWGLSYHLSGNKIWAEHFRGALYMLNDRARKTGYWISEPWTNVYFNFTNLILAWELIDDDPFFTIKDRKIIEEVLWGYTTFIRWLPNLDPDQAPPDEMRQNHTTFLALSLYFAHRYYTSKYDLEKELAPMMDKVTLAFERGQANSFIPNDDAGGYLNYSPLHTMTYLLAEGNFSYIEKGHLARTADLVTAVIDNRGDEVSFGDVGGYSHNSPNSSRGKDLMFFGMASHYYNQPEYKWLYNWLSKDKVFNLNNLYSGEYVTPMVASPPLKYTGIQTVPLDDAGRAWFGRRSWSNEMLPRSADNYFHKIAFRRNFDPNDEYLLLDGLSALSHGHHDGNSILRLTWKDRIWLFDLDYIKFTTKYHNGITIVRNGIQEDPPLLTKLDFVANGTEFGVTRSTAQNYSGADWERTILWRKDSWFFVVDRVRANQEGDYRLVSRWRTRGDVSLENRRLRVVQGDKSFYIKSADTAPRRLEFELDGSSSNWSNYPWGKGGLDILIAQKEMKLATDEDFTFANLLSASDDTLDTGYDLLKVSENLYRVTSAEAPLLVGLDAEWLEQFGLSTDAAMFIIESGALHFVDITRFRIQGTLLQDIPRQLTLDLKSGVLKDFEGNTVRKLNASVAKSLQFLVKGILENSAQHANQVQPNLATSAIENFGIVPLNRVEISAPITARSDKEDEGLILGDANGQIMNFKDDFSYDIIRTPAGAEITAIASGDIDGDGRPEIIAGDRKENLYCYNAKGELLWQHKLTPFNGRNAYAIDITVKVIDNGNKPVILVGNVGWKLYAFEPGGQIRWESFVYYHPITRIGVLEAGKNKRYVVAGTEYHTPFNVINPKTGIVMYYAWEEMGSEFLSRTEYFGIHLTDMTYFDANGDGLKDIVFGTLSNHIYAVNAADGTKLWEANTGGEVTALAQFIEPSKGSLRLLVANDAGDLSVYDQNGKRLHRALLGTKITSLQVLPPQRGRVDIAATTVGGDLIILDDLLLVRAAHHFDKPLIGIDLTGQNGSIHQLLVTGADFVQSVNYEAFYLYKSSRY